MSAIRCATENSSKTQWEKYKEKENGISEHLYLYCLIKNLLWETMREKLIKGKRVQYIWSEDHRWIMTWKFTPPELCKSQQVSWNIVLYITHMHLSNTSGIILIDNGRWFCWILTTILNVVSFCEAIYILWCFDYSRMISASRH